jgi:acetylornithine deacetylase/succinyl-diaminopimelate desuccinylase-like protein
VRRVTALILLSLFTGACGPRAGGPATIDPVPTTTSLAPVATIPLATTTTLVATGATTTTAAPVAEIDRSPEATIRRCSADLDVLLANGPRVSGSEAEAAAADYLAAALRDLTGIVFSTDVPLTNGLSSRNVWTAFGTGEIEVLLGAHYDSVVGAPGADDNGSGTVVLLELARRLHESPYSGLRVTIVFFGAEEILAGYPVTEHHFGSRQMADRLERSEALPDWMVSVDMVGVGPDLYAVTYRDTDPAAADLLVQAAAGIGIEVQNSIRGDISDHEAFARRGVPAAFLWRPDNPDYHRAGDDHVDPQLLLDDIAVLESLLAALDGTG